MRSALFMACASRSRAVRAEGPARAGDDAAERVVASRQCHKDTVSPPDPGDEGPSGWTGQRLCPLSVNSYR